MRVCNTKFYTKTYTKKNVNSGEAVEGSAAFIYRHFTYLQLHHSKEGQVSNAVVLNWVNLFSSQTRTPRYKSRLNSQHQVMFAVLVWPPSSVGSNRRQTITRSRFMQINGVKDLVLFFFFSFSLCNLVYYSVATSTQVNQLALFYLVLWIISVVFSLLPNLDPCF